MAKTGIFHHVGTFLIFASFVLLLITTISAPVIHDISILKVTLTNHTDLRNTSVTFGTFGHCLLDVAPINTDQDYCSGKNIGYSPAVIMSEIEGTGFSKSSAKTADDLTSVMILHPIACGLAFIAFLLALGSGLVGALFASLVCAITWVITVVAMACDFVTFGIIKNHVNKDGTGSHAVFGPGMWTLLAAMILLFISTFIVLFTCFSARRHRHDDRVSKGGEVGYANGTTTRRRRFWQRSSRTRY